jgi:glycosyltransferase involved in cell wall biosynthesis
MAVAVSVVIPTLNCESTMEECIKSIYANHDAPPFEVIIVDGGSRDNTVDIAQKYGVRIYTSPKPQSRQRNLGISMAAGDIIAFTDSDCRVKSDWLSVLYEHFRDGTIASVGGPNLTPDDDPFLARCFGALMESVLGSAGVRNTAVYRAIRQVEHNPPVNSAVRKRILDEVGGFAADFAVAEDVMLDAKICEKGYKLVYDPRMIVWHHRRRTLSGFVKQLVGYGRGRVSAFRHYPRSLPLTYLCTLLFAVGIFATVPLLVFSAPLRPVVVAAWILYFSFALLFSSYVALQKKKFVYAMVLPFIAFVEHFSLGLGMIQGILSPLDKEPSRDLK